MSQHERASSWVDNLPTTESSDATGTGGRDQRQSGASTTADTRSTMLKLRDTAHDTNRSSCSVSDDTK